MKSLSSPIPIKSVLIPVLSQTRGGIATVVKHQLEVLRNKGIRTHLVFIGKSSHCESLGGADTIETIEIDDNNLAIMFDRPIYFWKNRALLKGLQKRLSELVNKYQPTLIHAHRPGFALVCKKSGVPVVITLHTIWPTNGLLNKIRNAYTTRVLNTASLVYGVAKAALKPFKLKRQNVVYNGIPPIVRAERMAQTPVIGLIGRIKVDKGLHRAIEAFNNVIASGIEAKLIIAGSTETASQKQYLSELEKLANKSPNISFKGQMRAEDFYQQIDILCVPSFSEVCSMVILEAFSSGIPVVATAVGGTPELIEHGKTGLLVKADDAASLATQLITLIKDKDLQRRISDNEKAIYIEKFSLDKWSINLLQVYETAIVAK